MAHLRTEYEISYRVGAPRKQEIDPTLFVAVDLADTTAHVGVELVSRKGSAGREEDEEQTAVDYQVRYVLPERNRVSREMREMARAGKGMETAVTARYEGEREDDFTYLQIDVAQVPVGIHKLTVTVRDVQTGLRVERSVLFRVIEGQ